MAIPILLKSKSDGHFEQADRYYQLVESKLNVAYQLLRMVLVSDLL